MRDFTAAEGSRGLTTVTFEVFHLLRIEAKPETLENLRTRPQSCSLHVTPAFLMVRWYLLITPAPAHPGRLGLSVSEDANDSKPMPPRAPSPLLGPDLILA